MIAVDADRPVVEDRRVMSGSSAPLSTRCLLRAVGFAVYFVSHTYALFLVAEAIDAVGTTFCNGAVDAWGVDALDEAGFEGPKHGLFSRVSQLSSLGFMATALAGAYVGSLHIAWPWLLGRPAFSSPR